MPQTHNFCFIVTTTTTITTKTDLVTVSVMIYSFSVSMVMDDYNGEWERGQRTNSVFARVIFRWIVCKDPSDKRESFKKKKKSREEMRGVSDGVEKTWKTFLIPFWGHDLLLLPENIHLIKWNTSIWEIWTTRTQADFEVVQKKKKEKKPTFFHE